MPNPTHSSQSVPQPIEFAHAESADTVVTRLDARIDCGLSSAQAQERGAKYGPNRLPEAPTRSAWLVFFGQFKSILILILIGAALLSALIGNVKDAVVILAVVVINALVGFYQEYRAERSLAALKEMLPVKTHVRREGEKHAIAAEELVPGDVVLLEAGDRVPADGRLFLAAGLEIDESALTGESQPVAKQPEALVDRDAPRRPGQHGLHEHNAHAGPRRTRRHRNRRAYRDGAAVAGTRCGCTAPTPLQIQLDRLGKRLGAIALTLVGLLSFLELLRGTDLAHIVLDAIALAVAAMPEGLPVVVTVTLALGMHKMARQRAIVKRLASVETLGCTTVICSDKTGTLTLNQMTARAFFYQGERFEVSGEGYRLKARSGRRATVRRFPSSPLS